RARAPHGPRARPRARPPRRRRRPRQEGEGRHRHGPPRHLRRGGLLRPRHGRVRPPDPRRRGRDRRAAAAGRRRAPAPPRGRPRLVALDRPRLLRPRRPRVRPRAEGVLRARAALGRRAHGARGRGRRGGGAPPRRRMTPRPLFVLAAVVAAAALAGCSRSREAARPDDQYGHRYEGVAPDGRETVLLTPADTAEAYLVMPAVLDSVAVRPAQREALPGEAVPVEVLIKGALPDACSVLDEAVQTRAMNLIDVTLTMRRPRGTVCAQVVRPFRFYLPLDGTFAPGSYTLKVNGAAYPFRIREGEVENG